MHLAESNRPFVCTLMAEFLEQILEQRMTSPNDQSEKVVCVCNQGACAGNVADAVGGLLIFRPKYKVLCNVQNMLLLCISPCL